MEARMQTIRLDSNILSVLHDRAENQHQSVEDYTNRLLRVILDLDYTSHYKQEDDKRLQSIDRLVGVLHDDGTDYKQTKLQILEERYGKI